MDRQNNTGRVVHSTGHGTSSKAEIIEERADARKKSRLADLKKKVLRSKRPEQEKAIEELRSELTESRNKIRKPESNNFQSR